MEILKSSEMQIKTALTFHNISNSSVHPSVCQDGIWYFRVGVKLLYEKLRLASFSSESSLVSASYRLLACLMPNFNLVTILSACLSLERSIRYGRYYPCCYDFGVTRSYRKFKFRYICVIAICCIY